MMRRILRSEDGATIVESALSLSLLLGLAIGIMQMCQGLYAYHYTADAARIATRYAMVRGSSCTTFASACPAAASDVQSYIRGLGFPGINSSNVTVTTTWPSTGSACTPSATPCNNPGNVVQVRVQYAATLAIPFLRNVSLNVSSTSQMVISQ